MRDFLNKYWQIAFEAESEGKGNGGEVSVEGDDSLQMTDPTNEGAGGAAGADPTQTADGVSTGEETAASSSDAQPAPSTSQSDGPKEDWKDKRIARLTAQLHELRETRKQNPGAEPANKEPLDPTADFNRRVSEAAAQQVEIQRFNDQCNAVAQQGKQEFGEDFQHRVNQLKKLVNENDAREVEQYMGLLRAAIKTGEGHKLLYDLGSDLNKANDILNLDQTSMAIELTKMALAKPPTAEVSNLPRPVRPVGGTTGSQREVDPTDPSRSDNLSTAEWMRRREAQLASQSRR